MPWSKDIEGTEAWKIYSTLAKIKTTEKVFLDGGFKVLWDNDYVFSYARFTPEDLWITVCSADNQDRKINLPLDIFGESFATLTLPSQDELGQVIRGQIKDGELILEVPAGKAFLIKL